MELSATALPTNISQSILDRLEKAAQRPTLKPETYRDECMYAQGRYDLYQQLLALLPKSTVHGRQV